MHGWRVVERIYEWCEWRYECMDGQQWRGFMNGSSSGINAWMESSEEDL